MTSTDPAGLATIDKLTVLLASFSQPSAGGTVGSVSVYDTATLAGGYAETGNVVFTLYNSSNVAVFSSTKSASGLATYASKVVSKPRSWA